MFRHRALLKSKVFQSSEGVVVKTQKGLPKCGQPFVFTISEIYGAAVAVGTATAEVEVAGTVIVGVTI